MTDKKKASSPREAVRLQLICKRQLHFNLNVFSKVKIVPFSSVFNQSVRLFKTISQTWKFSFRVRSYLKFRKNILKNKFTSSHSTSKKDTFHLKVLREFRSFEVKVSQHLIAFVKLN